MVYHVILKMETQQKFMNCDIFEFVLVCYLSSVVKREEWNNNLYFGIFCYLNSYIHCLFTHNNRIYSQVERVLSFQPCSWHFFLLFYFFPFVQFDFFFLWQRFVLFHGTIETTLITLLCSRFLFLLQLTTIVSHSHFHCVLHFIISAHLIYISSLEAMWSSFSEYFYYYLLCCGI